MNPTDLPNLSPDLPSGDYGASVFKMLLALLILLVLAGVTVWFLRWLIQQRLRRGVGLQSIQVLEKKMISPKTMIYLLEIEGKRVAVAESHLEVRVLEMLPVLHDER